MRPHFITAFMICISLTASAAEKSDIQAAIEKLNPGSQVEVPRETPIKGLYQTAIDGINGYATADGRYFVAGDLFDVAERRNLSEDVRKERRLADMATTDMSSAIVFSPSKTAHTITVFTDVECGFCRKLHSEIAQYHKEGIAVRYLAFPRSGPGSDAWKTMEAVWCAKDRGDALTRVKRGEKIEAPANCAPKAIAEHYALGEKLHLQGTPMIVLEDGTVLGGYVSAQQLAVKLNENAPKQAAAR